MGQCCPCMSKKRVESNLEDPPEPGPPKPGPPNQGLPNQGLPNQGPPNQGPPNSGPPSSKPDLPEPTPQRGDPLKIDPPKPISSRKDPPTLHPAIPTPLRREKSEDSDHGTSGQPQGGTGVSPSRGPNVPQQSGNLTASQSRYKKDTHDREHQRGNVNGPQSEAMAPVTNTFEMRASSQSNSRNGTHNGEALRGNLNGPRSEHTVTSAGGSGGQDISLGNPSVNTQDKHSAVEKLERVHSKKQSSPPSVQTSKTALPSTSKKNRNPETSGTFMPSKAPNPAEHERHRLHSSLSLDTLPKARPSNASPTRTGYRTGKGSRVPRAVGSAENLASNAAWPREARTSWDLFRSMLTSVEKVARKFPPLDTSVNTLLTASAHVETSNPNAQGITELYETMKTLASTLLTLHVIKYPMTEDLKQHLQWIARAFEYAGHDINLYRGKERVSRFIDGDDDATKIVDRMTSIKGHSKLLQICISLASEPDTRRTHRQSLLSDLKHVPGAAYNSASTRSHAKPNDGRHNHVLTRHSSWASDIASKPLLCLYGAEGVGKSMVARAMCEDFDFRGVLGASFFCSGAGDVGQNDVRLIIPTVAFQLAHRVEGFMNFLCREMDRQGVPAPHTLDTQDQLSRLLLAPLEKARPSRESRRIPLVIVLDGLDHCSDNNAVEEFMHTVSLNVDRIASLGLRLLFTTRVTDRSRFLSNTQYSFFDLNEALPQSSNWQRGQARNQVADVTNPTAFQGGSLKRPAEVYTQ